MPTLAGHSQPSNTMPSAALHPFRHVPPGSSDSDHDFDMTSTTVPYLGAASERTRQPRRTSALPYQNSSNPDSRDRGYPRNPRNLIVVIPPPDLPLNQGQLGNVLSMGPRHRLSHGILMPLFSSMFGQLNAIAHEYNFPSTAGLCLYLHVNENGMKMTPRISDDSWQYLFGHLFDGRSSPDGQQLPIGGSIEFDIDLNKARWFDTWVSGVLQDPPVVSSSRAAHCRGESQTINEDDHPVEDQWNTSGSHTLVTKPQPETLRHLPKRLSLVDRLELHSALATPKTQGHPDHTDSSPTQGTYASSPILQSAVPQVTGSDLERRVNSWRASTGLYPLSMAATYQPASDIEASACMTTMDEYALERNFRQAVRIDEFLSSVTSVGPRSLTAESPVVSSRPSSMHLDSHANGAVPLTPNTMKNLGPTNGNCHSVAEAPCPRAIWGNSFGWRSAMTWKQVYPYSAIQTKPAIQVYLQGANKSPTQYPDLVIYPAVGSQPDAQPLLNASKSSRQSVWGSSFGWQKVVTWRKAYPYLTVTMRSPMPVQLRGAGCLESKYPNLCIYPAVYPNLEIYPESTVEEAISELGDALYPNLVIYLAVYPHFDLYPKALEVNEVPKQEVNVRLVNVAGLMVEYPNITIYPDAYPHLEIYPTRDTKSHAPRAAWGASFGWSTAKTWFQVYPLHAVGPLTTARPVDGQVSLISRSGLAIAGIVVGKQAVWGNSFGWKSATTWRAVWPTLHSRTRSIVDPISAHLGRQTNSASHPHSDIYSPRAAISNGEESRPMKESRSSVDLALYYPNLVIYPVVYPHFDLYPAIVRTSTTKEHGKGESNLRRRRIEMWRARTAAQVGLSELLANNHIWEVDEPLQLDLADYAWSLTSAGPQSPLELSDSSSVLGSVHIDRRIQGSVPCTPSTATTWGPPDDDWYSEVESIERLPSPDLGQRVLDDVENMEFPCGSGYPHFILYPPMYPHFELHPTWENVTAKNQETETLVNSNVYPALDIYPAVYPHFNIYPVVDLETEIPSKKVSQIRHERVEVRLAAMYPNFDIYPACYPYNLDYIYPSVNSVKPTQISVDTRHRYPWLVVYPSVYPFITPYPSFTAEIGQPTEPEQLLSPIFPFLPELNPVNVKLPVPYPLLDIYSVGYPWSIESIYPPVSIGDYESVAVRPQYPYICIYPFVYPYSDDPVHIPGALDESEYESAKASLALSKLKPINLKSVVHPDINLYAVPPMPLPPQGLATQDTDVGDSATPPPRTHTTARRQMKTHMELHASVVRSLGKRPARRLKTHLQLHTEVFQDSVVWTPSGYPQDLSTLTRRHADLPPIPVPELQQRRSSRYNPVPRPSRPRSGTITAQPLEKVIFPLGQPPASAPSSPRVRRSGLPSQPSLAVSETPAPRASSPVRKYIHARTTSARLSQAVRSVMSGGHKRNSSTSSASSASSDHKERTKSPARLLSLVDRRLAVIPPLQKLQTQESFVSQGARAYEQAIAVNQSSGGTIDVKGTPSSFLLPPLPSITSMTDVAEAIQNV